MASPANCQSEVGSSLAFALRHLLESRGGGVGQHLGGGEGAYGRGNVSLEVVHVLLEEGKTDWGHLLWVNSELAPSLLALAGLVCLQGVGT